jgi:hypothetical protein
MELFAFISPLGALLALLLLFFATVTTSTGLKNAQLERLFNGGSGTTFNSGKLQIWTGSPPGADAAPTGTKIFEETLPADAFNAASGGAITGAGTWSAAGINGGGNAGYWRLIKSGDLETNNTTDERLQGTCTATGGGGDMTLDNISIADAQVVTVSTKTVTHG